MNKTPTSAPLDLDILLAAVLMSGPLQATYALDLDAGQVNHDPQETLQVLSLIAWDAVQALKDNRPAAQAHPAK